MLSQDAQRKKKDVILNFFEQLIQIAMSTVFILEQKDFSYTFGNICLPGIGSLFAANFDVWLVQ